MPLLKGGNVMIKSSVQIVDGFELLNNTIFDCKSISNKIKHATTSNLALIKSSLLSTTMDDNLVDNLNYIYSVFERYTDASSLELKSEEKLYLMYAFRDIIDDVNLKLNEVINQKNTASHHHPLPMIQISLTMAHYVFTKMYSTGMFGIIESDHPAKLNLSEEDVIKKINLLRSSIENSKTMETLEEELAAVKERNREKNTLLLSKMISFFNQKKDERAEVSSLDKFYVIRKQMNEQHLQKMNLPKEVISYFDVQRDIVNPVYKYLMDSEELIVTNAIKDYLPESLFKQETFQSTVRSLMLSLIDDKAKFIQDIELDAVEEFRKRLIDNLKLVFTGNNFARLAIHLNLQVQTALYALKAIDQKNESESIQTLIKHLGPEVSSRNPASLSNKFHAKMLNLIARNVAKLCAEEKMEAEIGDAPSRVLATLKNKMTSLGNASSEGILKAILKDTINLENFNQLNPIFNLKKDNAAVSFFGLEGQIEKLNVHSDTLVLFMVHSLCEAVEQIAQEARVAQSQGLSSDVSGFLSNEEARNELKESLYGIVTAIEQLGTVQVLNDHPGSRSFLNDLKVSFLMHFIEFQGEGGLTDPTTPAYKTLLKDWQLWLTQ